jgi:hypothetical protein
MIIIVALGSVMINDKYHISAHLRDTVNKAVCKWEDKIIDN